MPRPNWRDYEHYPSLALWFTPRAIREHFANRAANGEDIKLAEAVSQATDAQLAAVGEQCLAADSLYAEFHRLLAENVNDLLKLRGVVTLYFDPQAYRNETDDEELTEDRLREIGQSINDEVAASWHGYEAWDTEIREVK